LNYWVIHHAYKTCEYQLPSAGAVRLLQHCKDTYSDDPTQLIF
jgi:hypothetical protein